MQDEYNCLTVFKCKNLRVQLFYILEESGIFFFKILEWNQREQLCLYNGTKGLNDVLFIE